MAGIFDSGIFDSGIFDVAPAGIDGSLAGQITPPVGAFEGTVGEAFRGGGRIIRRRVVIEEEKLPPIEGVLAGALMPPVGAFEGEAEAFNVEELNEQVLFMLAA
jgi:hypothetical protein